MGMLFFVSPKMYHESNQRFFVFIKKKKTIWQLFNLKITVFDHLQSTLNPSSVPLYIKKKKLFILFIYYIFMCVFFIKGEGIGHTLTKVTR